MTTACSRSLSGSRHDPAGICSNWSESLIIWLKKAVPSACFKFTAEWFECALHTVQRFLCSAESVRSRHFSIQNSCCFAPARIWKDLWRSLKIQKDWSEVHCQCSKKAIANEAKINQKKSDKNVTNFETALAASSMTFFFDSWIEFTNSVANEPWLKLF